VRPEGLGNLKIHLKGSRTRDLPACSVVPRAPPQLQITSVFQLYHKRIQINLCNFEVSLMGVQTIFFV
jgi:hypothetical protein